MLNFIHIKKLHYKLNTSKQNWDILLVSVSMPHEKLAATYIN